MLDRGTDLRLIMETLGHSQISVTADLYTHVLPQPQRAASEAVDALIFGEHNDAGDDLRVRRALPMGSALGPAARGRQSSQRLGRHPYVRSGHWRGRLAPGGCRPGTSGALTS
jgi:hypothetical protein